MIEAERVFFPKNAPWTADFLSEILAFPNGKFDDQVDSMTQFLIWQRDRERRRPPEVNLYFFGTGSRRKRPSNYFERNGGRPPVLTDANSDVRLGTHQVMPERG